MVSDERIRELIADLERSAELAGELDAAWETNAPTAGHLAEQAECLRELLEARRRLAQQRDRIAGLEAERDRLAAEVERLRAALRDVLDGDWTLTGIQEILGDLERPAEAAKEKTDG